MAATSWKHVQSQLQCCCLQELHHAGLGVIIRDWRDEAIGALSMSVPATQSVVELEALACCRAMQFAMELGLQDVVFEGDSLQVIQAIS